MVPRENKGNTDLCKSLEDKTKRREEETKETRVQNIKMNHCLRIGTQWVHESKLHVFCKLLNTLGWPCPV